MHSLLSTKTVTVTNHHYIDLNVLIKYINGLSDTDKQYILNNTNNKDKHSSSINSINTTSKHFCKRCHRPITDLSSIKLGMGYCCYKKWLKENSNNYNKKLF